MKAPKNTKKPMIIYGLIVLIALVMINYILMPSLFSTPTADIDYKSFLTLVKSGQVDTVEIGDTYLSALVRDKSGQSVIYRTGLINDSKLVDRLLDANVKFGKVVSQEISPIVSLIIGYVLPLAMFIGLGYLMTRMLTKRMGGGAGAMSFGKANAKIYVEARPSRTLQVRTKPRKRWSRWSTSCTTPSDMKT